MIYCRSKRRCELDLALYGFVRAFFFLKQNTAISFFFYPSFLHFFNGCNMAVSNEFIGQTHVTYPFLDSLVAA